MPSRGGCITAPKKSTILGCLKARIMRISSEKSCMVLSFKSSSNMDLYATCVPFHSARCTAPNEPTPIFLPTTISFASIVNEPAALRSFVRFRCSLADSSAAARPSLLGDFRISISSVTKTSPNVTDLLGPSCVTLNLDVFLSAEGTRSIAFRTWFETSSSRRIKSSTDF